MEYLKHFAVLILKIFLGIFALFPVLWLLSTSFKLPDELYAMPPVIFPSKINLENYFGAVQAVPFFKYFTNTVVYVSVSVFLNTVISVLAGFSLAQKNRITAVFFASVLISLSIPKEIILIPVYSLVLKLNWADTFAGLAIPFAVDALSIFLMRQAFIAVPKELDEAAMIEGAGIYTRFYKIHLPLVKPFLYTTILFSFMGFWGDFLWPLIVLKSPENYTLQVGLNMMLGTFVNNFRFVAAGSILALIPVIVVFLAFQKSFMRGFISGTGK